MVKAFNKSDLILLSLGKNKANNLNDIVYWIVYWFNKSICTGKFHKHHVSKIWLTVVAARSVENDERNTRGYPRESTVRNTDLYWANCTASRYKYIRPQKSSNTGLSGTAGRSLQMDHRPHPSVLKSFLATAVSFKSSWSLCWLRTSSYQVYVYSLRKRISEQR